MLLILVENPNKDVNVDVKLPPLKTMYGEDVRNEETMSTRKPPKMAMRLMTKNLAWYIFC